VSRLLLVGREADLARLHAAFEAAVAGRRRLVFVVGEAGIGKTALVERFLSQLDTYGDVRIGRGQCVEQYGAGEAYLPVLEALGRMGREPHGEELVRILRQHAPTWLVQLPAFAADGDVEAVQRRAQGATRERMLRESIEAFDASPATPLVLVLEDLHWSDSATIGLPDAGAPATCPRTHAGDVLAGRRRRRRSSARVREAGCCSGQAGGRARAPERGGRAAASRRPLSAGVVPRRGSRGRSTATRAGNPLFCRTS
jgi:hypothetical protein